MQAADPALAATIHAPGLAEPTARRGSYLRTVLRDAGADVDVIDYHQYDPGRQSEYAARVAAIRELADAAGALRPLFVSEYNVSRSGERGDVDEPADALALAEAQRQLVLAGIEGMLVYRFNFPSEFRNLSLVRSGPGSGRALVAETLGYHVFKQFARAAAGGKELLELEATGLATWLATRDDEHVFVLSIHRGGEHLPVEMDLSGLDVEGRAAIVWAASPSPAHRNEIVSRPTVADGRLALDQPPSSVVLIAIHRGPGPGALVALRVEPELADLERSRVRQLHVIGTFTDGTELDVSDRVSWSSAAPEVVRVNSTGLAVGLAPGTADLTASWDDLSSTPAPLAVR